MALPCRNPSTRGYSPSLQRDTRPSCTPSSDVMTTKWPQYTEEEKRQKNVLHLLILSFFWKFESFMNILKGQMAVINSKFIRKKVV
jgi:hypothetical protein